MAVSYWSCEILKDLGLRARMNETEGPTYRVICDLVHIACHWQPIEEFVNSGVYVKSVVGLHSKVWIGQDLVIVGSANSSHSALHFHPSSRGNVETGLKITNKQVVRSTKEWFREVWDGNEAKSVTTEDLRVKKRHHPRSQRPSQAPLPSHRTPLRLFEDFVGDLAGQNYRENLRNLGLLKWDNHGIFA